MIPDAQNLAAIATSAAGAAAAGLVTSLHCAGMCGPLACGLMGGERAGLRYGAYHAGRMLSYSLVGSLLASAGATVAQHLRTSWTAWLPWALVGMLLVVAVGWDRRLSLPAGWAGRPLRWVMGQRPAPGAGAFFLGLASPLFPCAPLYLIFGVTLLAPGALAGAAIAGAFALGTVPGYWLLQAGWLRLGRALSPANLDRTRRGLALLAAGLAAWRILLNPSGSFDHAACPYCQG